MWLDDAEVLPAVSVALFQLLLIFFGIPCAFLAARASGLVFRRRRRFHMPTRSSAEFLGSLELFLVSFSFSI